MKILEIQDVHINPKRIEEGQRHVKKICDTAKEQQVDGITIAGDFFDCPIMANDKSSWGKVLQMARDLQEAAPVFYITGTISHDAPGAYESFKDIGWKEINIGKSEKLGKLLIMGIPEITPAFILAQSPGLSKTEAIASQHKLIESIIDSYYTPLANSHNGPVLFMGHGHVRGVKFREDQKPRSSDFMYSEQLLGRIGADRVQFGHIHLPQEFKTINGGYGGSAHISWNDLGFKPGFNVAKYEYNGGPQEIYVSKARFDYGDLERQKITLKTIDEMSAIPKDIKDNVDLWIDVFCDKSLSEQIDLKGSLGIIREKKEIGALSKVTTNIQRVENVRVDTEGYEKCQTLEDLYEMFDTEVSPSTLLKVREAEEKTLAEIASPVRRNFEFLDLYLKGSKAGRENGVDEIKMDFNDFQSGANLVTGDNGRGKSFTLGFCTPYSEHLPTGKNLKDLFDLKDSQIIRRWKDGENIITQKILIDPTLATPSAKYYMDINGEALNPDGNKKSFDDIVVESFGSIKMFMTCVFRGQKENPNYPSLENAREPDLRKIFTELSGIDRSPLKNFAHNKAIELDQRNTLNIREIETLESSKEDEKALEVERGDKAIDKSNLEVELKTTVKSLEGLKAEYSEFEKNIVHNENIQKQIADLNSEATNLTAGNALNDRSLRDIDATLNNSKHVKAELDTLKGQQAECNVVAGEYFALHGEFNKQYSTWVKDKDAKSGERDILKDKGDEVNGKISAEERTISSNKSSIEKHETSNSFLNKPCEHCGKLSSSAEEDIYKNNLQIEILNENTREAVAYLGELKTALEGYRKEWKEITFLPEPIEPEKLNLLKREMDRLAVDGDHVKKLETAISSLDESRKKKTDIEGEIQRNKERIAAIGVLIDEMGNKLFQIDKIKVSVLKESIAIEAERASASTSSIGRLTAEIEGLMARMVKAVEMGDKIKAIQQRVDKEQSNISEWKRIEEAFSPKGIPALELSMLSPQIDREANKLLAFYGTRFSVETITQEMDSRGKNLIERFKILVHDTMASEVKNLPDCSPGQNAWIVKALLEAISKVAIERTGRNWLYSIMDEADGPLDTATIVDFYDMMDKAMDGQRKLVAVTHSSEAKASISSILEITKCFVGYGG